MGAILRRIWIPILAWFLGNITWSLVIFGFTKFTEQTVMVPAIGAIGFLVLILVGVIGTGWYFLRERTSPTTEITMNNMARWVIAIYFAQRYKVEPDALIELSTVEAMEERALRLVAERGAV